MYERPSNLRMTELDPNAPGVVGLIRGERGQLWKHFTLVGITILPVLNIIAAVYFLT